MSAESVKLLTAPIFAAYCGGIVEYSQNYRLESLEWSGYHEPKTAPFFKMGNSLVILVKKAKFPNFT